MMMCPPRNQQLAAASCRNRVRTRANRVCITAERLCHEKQQQKDDKLEHI
jgi:hypothetical protein